MAVNPNSLREFTENYTCILCKAPIRFHTSNWEPDGLTVNSGDFVLHIFALLAPFCSFAAVEL